MLSGTRLNTLVLIIAAVMFVGCSQNQSEPVEPTRSPDQVKSILASWLLETDIKLAEVDSRRARSLSPYNTGGWSVESLDDGSWIVTTASRVYTVFPDGPNPVLVANVTPTPTTSPVNSEVNPIPGQIPFPTPAPVPTPTSVPLGSGQLVRFIGIFSIIAYPDVSNCLTEGNRVAEAGAGSTAVIVDTQPECGKDGLFQVRFDNGVVGWVRGSNIEAIDP